jgi:hypothetical protein
MSVLTPRDTLHLRNSIMGPQLIKASQPLPQNATATLATVSGGMVLLTSFLGFVTTAIGATAMNLSIGTVPTLGVASTSAIAAPTPFASTAMGSWITPVQSAGVSGQLAVGAVPGDSVFLMTPLVVSAGTITWTTTAANTGAVKWYFTWLAVDTGAALQ